MGRTVLLGLLLIIAVLCGRLGIWQLDRFEQRRTANREAEAARAMPPLVVDSGVGLESYRRIRIRGTLDEAREFMLRNRLVRGVPAVVIVTPLRAPGRDSAILVNRGYVPATDATNPSASGWTEPGERVVTGVAFPVPERGDGAPFTNPRTGRETWAAMDLDAMRQRLPYPVSGLYLLAEADPGSPAHTADGGVYPIRAERPLLGDGPHLAYAVQWFGIGAAALAFGVVFVLRKPRSRLGDQSS